MHHVYARGNDRRRIYLDNLDRATYLILFARVVRRMRWRCLAYCLMENHVHLLIETPEPNLGAGMQRLHGNYAQTFNERHGRSGHVFQGRYGAVRVTSDEQLWAVVRYIVRNPVEAGLCEHPDDWPWGSHAAVLGESAPSWLDIERLMSCFEAAGGDERLRYAELVSMARPPLERATSRV